MKLATMFGGSVKEMQDGTPVVDSANLRAFIVRYGQPMRAITLDEAATHVGLVRLLTAKDDPQGLTEEHKTQLGALLSPNESRKEVQSEQLSIDWAPKSSAAGNAATLPVRPAILGSKLMWPICEAKFLAKTFAASLVKPIPTETLGGLATKSFPLVASISVYWATVGLAHPFALVGLIALCVIQEAFHGFFLKSWNNFQESLRRARGFNYQMFFNLAYMQGSGMLYRVISWTANPMSVTPPWSVSYWRDMAVMSVVGTFFGVLGYNSLNVLYAKGSLSRWQHSGIQHMRDLCFLLAAPFFASGSMRAFWAIFLFQQSLDLMIAIWAGSVKAHLHVLVTTEAVSNSAEFKERYPVEGVNFEPPLCQAGKAVIDNPIVQLMRTAFRDRQP